MVVADSMFWLSHDGRRPFKFNEKKIFRIPLKVGSSHLYASFGTFSVEISQLFEAQWDFKLSEEFEIDAIFLRKILWKYVLAFNLNCKKPHKATRLFINNFLLLIAKSL